MTPAEQTFVEAFRAGTLANDQFHHRDHVHMAWLYVRTHGLESALSRFSADLRAFAAAKGVPGLYHATITWSFLAIVAERHRQSPAESWEAFEAQHPDLLHWKPSVLEQYYSAERLWSDLAREMFLLPDRAPAEPA